MKFRVCKVHKLRAPDGRMFLVALAGDGHFSPSLLKWMRGGEHPGKSPDENATIAVVIDEQLRIWRMSSNGLNYCQVLEKVHASGAGQDFAIGALEAGATAVQAIKIAEKRSDMAGLGVDSVRF
jgi:ATP-dependent HslUV protease subunit HslV